MTLDDLRVLAHEFFEWPDGSDRQIVTTFSALLFTKHVLEMREMHEKHEKHEKSLGAENSAGMDALRAAAQQALEALKDYKCSDDDRVSIAMHILSTALEREQAEPVQEPVAWMIYTQDGRSAYVTDNPTDVVDVQKALPLYAALKQEQAEPVAWRTFDGEGGFDYRDYEGNEDYAAEWAQRNPNYAGWVEPLYTAPPQRKPLTEEEEE